MDNENESAKTSDNVSKVIENSSEAEQKAKPKKRGKQVFIVLGVILVVLCGAGLGLWVWHNDPSFCNAFCHEPMDPYVEGYYSSDPTLLAALHAIEGEDCLSCHVPTIGQQVTEGLAWITGNYQVPLAMTKIGTREFCLACHDNEETIQATVNYNGTARNPHNSHYGDAIECYSCHRAHRESVMYCNSCHPDIKGPDTWAK
jgi:nitrate/TMAO reductase-like tetraheme cytochrome c subunit